MPFERMSFERTPSQCMLFERMLFERTPFQRTLATRVLLTRTLIILLLIFDLTHFPIFFSDLVQKENQISDLTEEIDKLKVELEMVKDDLETRVDEIADLQTDLEVKEAGFNNSIHENDEAHKEEIEILVTKVEDAKGEISELSEALAR